MRVVALDGSPAAVGVLVDALREALDGGPAVLPIAPGAAAPATVPEAPTGTAVAIATSGSTGEPKLVALSAAALRASATATATRLGGPARWLLALPAEHVAGVQVIIRALLAGAEPVVQDLRAGFRTVDFTTATEGLGSELRHTSLVPTQLGRILDEGGRAVEALRGYAAVLVGGAALPPALHDRATAAGVRVVTTYGMSETAGGCVYDGVPLDGVTVDLDADGRIRLGGPTVATGYLGQPAETSAAFVDGRFVTGDLGRWRDGRLEVLGRADDVIITGGEKVAPAAVERVLAAQPDVEAVCVVGLPDPEWGQIVAAAVVRGSTTDADWIEPLRTAVRAELGRAAVPRRWQAIAALPVRGIGKPDRAAVMRLVSKPDGDRHHIG
ncbi:o-succinylbenzoate--CoA ligase [Pseudonocardia sp. GCM10023141]|uniref:o-succinylbenzoate--CoA ligase n=1 Tax=Pseudonocardia sp. GCM10023141 TaxID=3252653 RepID=UPI0036141DD9